MSELNLAFRLSPDRSTTSRTRPPMNCFRGIGTVLTGSRRPTPMNCFRGIARRRERPPDREGDASPNQTKEHYRNKSRRDQAITGAGSGRFEFLTSTREAVRGGDSGGGEGEVSRERLVSDAMERAYREWAHRHGITDVRQYFAARPPEEQERLRLELADDIRRAVDQIDSN